QILKLLKDVLGIEFHAERLDFDGVAPIASIEGLRFGLCPRDYDSQYGTLPGHLYLLGRCPDCGAEAESPPVYSLAALGQLIEKFAVDRTHHCPPHPVPDPPHIPRSIGARLEALLRGIVAEELAAREEVDRA